MVIMGSLSFLSSFFCPSIYQQPPLPIRLRLYSNCVYQDSSSQCSIPRHLISFSSLQFDSSRNHNSLMCSATLPEEGVIPVMNFEELVEKDWSFLESDSSSSKEEFDEKNDQIISAGNVGKTSKVLVSIGSDEFVDRLVDSSPCQLLLVVHESLLSLACIKERHDRVKCWQGELIFVPDKWAPLDVIFLYCLPALPFKLDEIFKALAERCAPGARVVISHLLGKQGLELQRREHSDIIVTDLPDKTTLEKVASNYSFVIKDFVDDSSFYLAVLVLEI